MMLSTAEKSAILIIICVMSSGGSRAKESMMGNKMWQEREKGELEGGGDQWTKQRVPLRR